MPGIIAAEKAAGKFTKVGSPNHIVLFTTTGRRRSTAGSGPGEEDATISQPANLYAKFAVFYAKQAVAGTNYRAGMKTDHGSKIVNAPRQPRGRDRGAGRDKTNVNDPTLWGNYKRNERDVRDGQRAAGTDPAARRRGGGDLEVLRADEGAPGRLRLRVSRASATRSSAGTAPASRRSSPCSRAC